MGWKVFETDFQYPDVYCNIRNTDTYKAVMSMIKDAKACSEDVVKLSGHDDFHYWDLREVALCMNFDFGWKVKFVKGWARDTIEIYFNEKEKR